MRILLGGDAMLGRGVNQTILKKGPEYPLEPLLPITREADFFFVNLECAITPLDRLYSGPIKMFYFRADPLALQTLTYAGVDLLSLANNHALDADFDGLLDTLDLLQQAGTAFAGAGKDLAEARLPAFLELDDRRLAVLSYCDHQPDFAAGVDRPGIRYIDLSDEDALELLAAEVEQVTPRVDVPIVSFHWQPNWAPQVPDFYRSLAKRLVDAGAKIIWGHSPHHFQGVEWIESSVVIYSSGGLVDDYALDLHFRNDRQLLFRVHVDNNRIRRVLAYPIELEFARTRPASPAARRWIIRRFRNMCMEVGSRVEIQGEWLEVFPMR